MRRVLFVVLVVLVGSVPLPAVAAEDLMGIIVNGRGVPLADVDVARGGVVYTTDDDGRFRLVGASAGAVSAERVAYVPQTASWDGRRDFVTITLPERIARGIHIAGWVPATDAGFQQMLDIGATTSVNTLMIDIKNENGKVYHLTDNPTVRILGAQAAESFDLAGRTAQAHAQGFYVVVRIVTFQDPIAARARPEWAVTDPATGGPLNKGGQFFLDPTDPDPREYALRLAEEACEAGVDEVQFDYVRFPDGAPAGAGYDGRSDQEGRIASITDFLAQARARLEPMGCATAADIFGWITNTTGDGGIGQQLESIADVVDVVSPMIYPSHYSPGWYGFEVPNDHPGPVVTHATNDALRRMAGSQAVLRPWLQDFWYTPDQVRAQIRAVDGLGTGWMLWNILSEFSVSGIPQSGELVASHAVPAPVFIDRPASGFFDVTNSNTFASDVAWMADEAITGGCNPPWSDFYCPELSVTRGQMAAFLVRSLGLTGSGPSFSDTGGSVFAADISRLAAAGITRGCNPPANTRFCPDEPVTRGQMAAFLVRALELSEVGPSFSDTGGSVFAADVSRLAAAGITRGCNPPANTRFCPDQSVTRAQMAAFLHRALAG
ncbi:MAG: putative glycoside hydrolase [Acidimicrobiia bacterium]